LQFAKQQDCDYTIGMNKPRDINLDKAPASERIAKRIARAGLCSRRDAEARIVEGRVSVNGKQITSPALNVTPADKIIVDGKPLPAREPAKLWRYHKPRGLVVSARDEKNRQTIFDTLPDHLPRMITVGRLDMDSEGLLLLTNDGELARHLELPSTGWSRKYRVRVQGHVDELALANLANGVTIDGIRYGQVDARLDRQMPSNAWLTVVIREGKNREVRRIMEHLGHKVGRLIRVSYGPFQLGELAEGGVEQVKPRVLADQLGIADTPQSAAANDGKATGKVKTKDTARDKIRTQKDPGARHKQRRTTPAKSQRGQDANHRRSPSRNKAGGSRRR
jgi:23S rRNA pseudouridine2605 synthase